MICILCYSNRPKAKRTPMGFPEETPVCTGCAIDMDKTLGFMALNGHGVMLNVQGVLHVVDIETGESWGTQWATVAEAGEAIAKFVTTAERPPQPPPKEK